jgi:hypothetical protein
MAGKAMSSIKAINTSSSQSLATLADQTNSNNSAKSIRWIAPVEGWVAIIKMGQW